MAPHRLSSRFCRTSQSSVVLAVACALLVAAPVFAESKPWWAGELGASTGMEWSRGDYDEPGDETEILYVPFSLSYRFDEFLLSDYPLDQIAFRVTVPYLEIDSPLAFFAETPSDGQQRVFGNRREHGVGDVVASATYTWYALDDRLPGLEFTGKIKIPTADEDKNLGTGAVDGFAQIDTFKTWGRLAGFATAGYRVPGDPPDGKLRDSGYASGGFSAKLLSRLSGGAYYSWFGAASSTRHDSHELIGFASLRLNDTLSVEPYAAWGIAGYAPDYALGFSLRVRTAIGR